MSKRQVSYDGLNWMDADDTVDWTKYRHMRTVDDENEATAHALTEGLAAAKEIADAADLRRRAFELYRGPFRYDHGYIWDKDGEMVADDHVEQAEKDIPALRIRGWGRMKYFADSAALQDAVGVLMAEAMTAYWKRRSR